MDRDQQLRNIALAGNSFVSVLIAPNGLKYISNRWEKLVTGIWKNLKGYPRDYLTECPDGYQVWFCVFCDATGEIGFFLYPESPCEGDAIEVITPVGTIKWVHGKAGLTEYCMAHYGKWILDIARYNDLVGDHHFDINAPIELVEQEDIKDYRDDRKYGFQQYRCPVGDGHVPNDQLARDLLKPDSEKGYTPFSFGE